MMIQEIRYPNTTREGRPFDPATIEAVWRKAHPLPTWDPAEHRVDVCGAPIRREAYGTNDELGWEIDHIIPVSRGGDDQLSNLQPLQWRNNRHKAEHWPHWTCEVES